MQAVLAPVPYGMFTGHPDQAYKGQHIGDQQTQRTALEPKHKELDIFAVTPMRWSAPRLPWILGSALVEQWKGEGI